MRFLNFEYQNEKMLGLLVAERVVPIGLITKNINIKKPVDMNEVIDTWDDEILTSVTSFLDSVDVNEIKKMSLHQDRVRLLAPIEYPKRNMFCLGKNYLDHALETRGLPGGDDDIPKFPIYFSKVAQPCIGSGDLILNHQAITDKVDYEVELAVIIGKDGININKEEAEDYIFGYTIVNDVSARNIQRKHGQWFKGKSLATYAPMGPVIVHKSEIKLPVKLKITCHINQELRQNSNTKNMIFDIPSIIHDLSKGMYLRKGDIILTGTPAGVGLGFTPPKFLKSGDLIACNIENIGTLINSYE